MRWIRIVFIVVAVLFGIYSLAMYYFVEESKNFTVEKVVDYPVDKVFPQFSNFQNFTRWNNYFSGSKTMGIDYYRPYEGMGSAISFHDREKNRHGEMFIRYENPGKSLKYELFEGRKSNPSQIDIKFIPLSAEKTRIVWDVHTSKQPLLKRSVNFWTDDIFIENIDKSLGNLHNLLSSKVEKSNMLASIKYDSLMVENMEGQLLLGVNVSTSNKKDALFRNIVMNHNKVYNYVTVDLAKNEDEFGLPVLITSPANFKDKEVSYFYGIPLSKRIGVTDNNFSFRTVNASKSYVIYYKGDYSGRVGSIQKLLQKAKKDTMRNGEVIQTFVEAPAEGKSVNMKITLPVYR